MKRRRWRTRAVAAATLSLALTACGTSSKSSAGGSGQIHVLVYGDATNKVETQIVSAFNKTSKVKAVLDTIPGADYQAKLQTIINSPQAPDVFFNWGGGSIQPFVKAGLLLPLDGFIAKNPALKSSFLPSVFNTAVLNGKSYGIPMRGTQPVLLFDNKKVLGDAGISPPATWNDLLADVAALKAHGKTPIALGGGDEWPTLMWFEYVYDRVAGPGLFTKALGGDKTVWAGADSRKALGMLKQLVDTGAFGKNFDSVKFTDGGSPALLARGKAGFELMGRGSTPPSSRTAPTSSRTTWGTPRSRPSPVAWATRRRGRQHQQLLLGAEEDQASRRRRGLPQAPVLRHVRPGTARCRQPADHHQHGEIPRHLREPRVLQVPVHPRAEGAVVPAVLGPGVSARGHHPIHDAVEGFFDGKLDANGFIKAMQGPAGGVACPPGRPGRTPSGRCPRRLVLRPLRDRAAGPRRGALLHRAGTGSALPHCVGLGNWNAARPRPRHGAEPVAERADHRARGRVPDADLSILLGVWAAGQPAQPRHPLGDLLRAPSAVGDRGVDVVAGVCSTPTSGCPRRRPGCSATATCSAASAARSASWCWSASGSSRRSTPSSTRAPPGPSPRSLYEAAAIDGAGRVRQLFHITLPLLRHTIITSMVLMIVGGLTTFDTVLILTQGGPGTDTTISAYYMYQEAFKSFDFGAASAIAVVLVLFATLVSLIVVRVSGYDKMRSTLEGL